MHTMLKTENNGMADWWSRLIKTGTLLAEVVNREEIEIRFTPYKEAHVQG